MCGMSDDFISRIQSVRAHNDFNSVTVSVYASLLTLQYMWLSTTHSLLTLRLTKNDPTVT